jgi:hypothetical protein
VDDATFHTFVLAMLGFAYLLVLIGLLVFWLLVRKDRHQRVEDDQAAVRLCDSPEDHNR